MQLTGILVTLFGLALAARSALLLSGRGRPQRGPQPKFIIAGPYTKIRNPLAAGAIIALTGLALTTRSPILGAAAIVAWLAVHTWIVTMEEPRLRARFGQTYDAYIRNVPRWLPAQRTRDPSE